MQIEYGRMHTSLGSKGTRKAEAERMSNDLHIIRVSIVTKQEAASEYKGSAAEKLGFK